MRMSPVDDVVFRNRLTPSPSPVGLGGGGPPGGGCQGAFCAASFRLSMQLGLPMPQWH
jgi:hypothetical protein